MCDLERFARAIAGPHRDMPTGFHRLLRIALALPDSAFYPVLVHRLAASLHASSPHLVALMQLRFASFAVINLLEDLHLQECASATK